VGTKNKRTPSPGVHPHLPVTPAAVHSEGHDAGSGVAASLSNPWGGHLGQSHAPRAPGQPPQPPPALQQMQGVPAPATPGVVNPKPRRTDRRPRTGDEG